MVRFFRRALSALTRDRRGEPDKSQRREISAFLAKMQDAGSPGLTKVRLIDDASPIVGKADEAWAWGYPIAIDYVTFADEAEGETWSIPAWVLVRDWPSPVLVAAPPMYAVAARTDKPVDPHMSLTEWLDRAYKRALEHPPAE